MQTNKNSKKPNVINTNVSNKPVITSTPVPLSNQKKISGGSQTKNNRHFVREDAVDTVTSSSVSNGTVRHYYPLNPGNVASFPTLGTTVAKLFNKFRVHSIELIYRTRCSAFASVAASGRICIIYNPDPTDGPFSTFATAERSQFFVAGNVYTDLSYKVPKKLHAGEFFVDETSCGAPMSQLRFTDAGSIQFLAQSPVTNEIMGDLFLKYDIEFIDPIDPGVHDSVLPRNTSVIVWSYDTNYSTTAVSTVSMGTLWNTGHLVNTVATSTGSFGTMSSIGIEILETGNYMCYAQYGITDASGLTAYSIIQHKNGSEIAGSRQEYFGSSTTNPGSGTNSLVLNFFTKGDVWNVLLSWTRAVGGTNSIIQYGNFSLFRLA